MRGSSLKISYFRDNRYIEKEFRRHKIPSPHLKYFASNLANSYFLNGLLRLKLSDSEGAIADFGRAYKLSPETAYSEQLCSTYNQMKDISNAIKYCEIASQSGNKNNGLYAMIGNVYRSLYKLNKACNYYSLLSGSGSSDPGFDLYCGAYMK